MTEDEQLWDGVLALHNRVEGELADALARRHGLGLSEYRALGHLAAAEKGELRMSELAVAVGLNQSSVTRLATRLYDAGYAVRDLCPDDKRGIYAVITAAGRTRHAEARRTYRQTLADAMKAASDESPRLAALLDAMRREVVGG
ncbi:MarR family winged helix-turn-helix transcriptional regulator [Catenulispora subtropica]|uniref:MarR family transcriptional regulator n=1 Tax=Catenulispora subtropica TaxID=450798 RepID=A0ABP5BYH7_9ACTN